MISGSETPTLSMLRTTEPPPTVVESKNGPKALETGPFRTPCSTTARQQPRSVDWPGPLTAVGTRFFTVQPAVRLFPLLIQARVRQLPFLPVLPRILLSVELNCWLFRSLQRQSWVSWVSPSCSGDVPRGNSNSWLLSPELVTGRGQRVRYSNGVLTML